MSREWEAVPLGELLSLRSGKAITGRNDSGVYPIYGSNGFIGRADGYNSPKGTTIIGRVGANCGSVTYSAADCWVTDNALVALSNQKSDSYFLYYLLSSLRLNTLSQGSGQPLINQQIIKSIMVKVPDLPEQRAISEVLGAFDDLIESNRKLSQDEMGLARLAVAKSIDDASEMRSLDQLANFVNGKNFTAKATGTGLPVIRTPEVRTGPTPSTVYNEVAAARENVASSGDILFVWSGSLMVDRWRWETALINQHVFKVIPKDGYPDWLVYFLIERQMQWFLSLAADKATTMGHIKREHLREDVPLPSRDEIAGLQKVVEPLWQDAFENLREIDRLTQTRDTLVPLLLSGKITPNSATKLLEDVTK